jgi:hypothetical protein
LLGYYSLIAVFPYACAWVLSVLLSVLEVVVIGVVSVFAVGYCDYYALLLIYFFSFSLSSLL